MAEGRLPDPPAIQEVLKITLSNDAKFAEQLAPKGPSCAKHSMRRATQILGTPTSVRSLIISF